MRHYNPEDGKWMIGTKATILRDLRDKMKADEYEAQKRALQEFLCGYFSQGDCLHRLGNAINPVGATEKGGKILKVRWGLPGRGKSGSLRLVVIAYCKELRVTIAQAFFRKDDPKEEDVQEAAEGH